MGVTGEEVEMEQSEGFSPNVWSYDPKEDNALHVMVRGIEADIHAKGWDGHARLGIVLRHELVEAGNIQEAWAVCEIPMFADFYDNPLAGLTQWNQNLVARPESLAHLDSLLAGVKEEFAGWMFSSETWIGDKGKGSDKPDEGRFVTVVLTDGRIVGVGRTRNTEGGLDKIVVDDSRTPDGLENPDVAFGGMVILNLEVLLAVSRWLIRVGGLNKEEE